MQTLVICSSLEYPGTKRLKHDLDWQSTAESISRCLHVGEIDNLALWAIVVVGTFVIPIECEQQLCIISSLWKRNTIWAKQKGFIGDVRESESWQLHHSLAYQRHLSDMASCTVTHGGVTSREELKNRAEIPAVLSSFTTIVDVVCKLIGLLDFHDWNGSSKNTLLCTLTNMDSKRVLPEGPWVIPRILYFWRTLFLKKLFIKCSLYD